MPPRHHACLSPHLTLAPVSQSSIRQATGFTNPKQWSDLYQAGICTEETLRGMCIVDGRTLIIVSAHRTRK
nr:hypothetical protein CFP56_39012 [Quercus suber]